MEPGVYLFPGERKPISSPPMDAPAPPSDTLPAVPEKTAGLRVHIALVLVQVIFGGFHVVAKAVLAVEPLALAGIRVALATPILALVAWRHDRVLPRAREIPRLVVLGGLGVTANQIFFITGLKHTTATNASILMTSIPVFAVAAAALSASRRSAPRRLVGIALSVAGALVLVNPLRFEGGTSAALGNGLILMNCLSYAALPRLQRPILDPRCRGGR